MNPFWEENIIKNVSGSVIKCKNCGTETKLYSPEKVEIVFCPKCLWIYSKNKVEYNKITKNKKNPAKPAIPLYSVCELNGEEYIVVGFAKKREVSRSSSKWEEYTLIDKRGELVYLNQSYGHWLFIKERQCPTNYDEKSKVFVNDDTLSYELFTSYYQITDTALGQFYYDVIDVKKRFTKEFISPPKIFTSELYNNILEYFEGEYIYPKQVEKAFSKNPIILPEKEGVGASEPFYFGIKPKRFATLSLILFVITFPIYLFISANESVSMPYVTIQGFINDSIKTQNIISEPFTIKEDGPIVLQFECRSNVDNDWMEGAFTLTNEKTGEERSFICGLEYYSGYDDEGSWSEGNRQKIDYLSSIPPGKYHIEADFYSNNYANKGGKTFDAVVSKSSAMTWNYLLITGIYILINIIVIILGNKFENKRSGIS